MGWFSKIFGPKPPSVVDQAIDEVWYQDNGRPLLELIVNGTIDWSVDGNRARSSDRRLEVLNDWYYYFYIYRNGQRYNIDNCLDATMASMITCAAINQSKIARAINNYTEFLAAPIRPVPPKAQLVTVGAEFRGVRSEAKIRDKP